MKVILKKVRMAFPELFVPKSIAGGKPRYGATFIIVPGSENAKKLNQAQTQVSKDKWEERAEAVFKELVRKDLVAYRKDTKLNSSGEAYDGFDGMHYVSTANKNRPEVKDRDKSPLTEADGRPYGGCYVNVSLDLYAQDHKEYGKRTVAKLLGVQFDSNGDSFGGGERADETDFDDISDTGDDCSDASETDDLY